ncbi:hypothetical protein [Bradyrhizobium tunisiense]|uniref:hypothetical protein n=1 Tax=Bradyrhizobium tunisiense TaxID=3278709 RepID=UPI0035E26C45
MNGDRHDVLFDGSHPLPSNYRAYRQSVPVRLVQLLRQNPECRFLEIGVGPTLRQERFRTISDLGIHYVGLDFERVCAQGRADLAAAGIADRNISFLGNPSGTYLFNLIRLARNRETFDIVYLDGSHSIHVDLAAAIAAIRLLRLGALFLFDDVRFSFGRRHLIQTTTQYADANENGQLTEDEASEPHVTIILRDYLIPLFSFEVERSWSDPDWIALRAPKSDSMDAALTVLPRSGSAIDVCTAVTNEAGMVRHLGAPEVAAMVIRGLELANVPDCRVVVLSKIDDRSVIKEPADKSATSSARRASRSRRRLRAEVAPRCRQVVPRRVRSWPFVSG